ncbi:MAG: group 1 truncated hemoglobin [Actinobacteria bacterium]|nr:MAG: group 1 truncated hemoglobin [Actinomycetota bacterium]
MQGTEASLYERLGGIFAIAAVVDDFSENILENAKVGKLSENPQLRDWSNNQPERLPGLKFMRTLWVQAAAGGPIPYVPTRPGHDTMGLENAHRDFRISPEEFDAVAGELENSLNHFGVPEREKNEVLDAFMAHKDEVTEGWRAAA